MTLIGLNFYPSSEWIVYTPTAQSKIMGAALVNVTIRAVKLTVISLQQVNMGMSSEKGVYRYPSPLLLALTLPTSSRPPPEYVYRVRARHSIPTHSYILYTWR